MIKLCEKATPVSSSSDKLTYLRHALKTIREVVIIINDAISSRDRARELLELQQAFNESPLISVDSPGRALVRCGQLQKLCRNGYKRKLLSLITRRFEFHVLTMDCWTYHIMSQLSFLCCVLTSFSMEKRLQV
mmetsp:Transcript_23535/g.39974  ORF Transcript_23535/g.39974 Transcript_23535/m.39974 type:complete len:133 (+) Transcript_23535:377-775(+)